MIGLFIGRFQPFHNGHLHVIKQMLEECDEIVIGIGSANSEITEQNPFSAAKRKKMVEKVMEAEVRGTGSRGAGAPKENLKTEPISQRKLENKKYRIVLINDQENHQQWAEEVRKKAEPFDILYVSGNNISHEFVRACGFEIKKVDFLNGISGTKIRELMKSKQPYQHLIPEVIAKDFH